MRSVQTAIVFAVVALATTANAEVWSLDASKPIPFFIGRAADDKVHPSADFARWAFARWAKASKGALEFVETDDEDKAIVRVYWPGPGGSKYGEMRAIEVDGKRGAEVYVGTSTAGLGEAIARRAERDTLYRDVIVFLTCVHEIGHAIGLSHTKTFADIMYSFQYGGDIENYFFRYRKRIKKRKHMRFRTPLSKDDIKRLRKLY